MTILITGANGQLGRELQDVLKNNDKVKVLATDVAELDITDRDAVAHFFDDNAIDYVVNCAAFTAVDAAEAPENRNLCEVLNVTAPATLASNSAHAGAKMIHISTDYVFPGTGCRPITEDDTTAPTSAYGSTKLAGEHAVTAANPAAIIIRTAWLYSPHGKNFVKTMLTLGKEREQLRVVCDQVGTPTYARDLALAITTLINAAEWVPGVYHFSNEGAISWYDFTKAIHRLAGITTCKVSPCLSKDYPTPAARPFYSVLNKSKIKDTYHIEIPYWEDSLKHCLSRLMQ